MNGILLIDKPKGWTSFDVVAKVRSILRQAQKQKVLEVSHLSAVQGSQEERANHTTGTESERQTPANAAMRQEPAGVASPGRGQQGKAVRKIRVGHTGTLDPLATGLLVILVGNYTKKATELTKADKTYEVTMKLGQTSTTGDAEGIITKTLSSDFFELSSQKVRKLTEVMKTFVGEIEQTPPVYSAVKVGGKRAYKLAREGKEVKLEPRKVKIYEITNIKLAPNKNEIDLTAVKSIHGLQEVKFTAKVSSGTYIRSLVEDIGQKLGTGAYMSDLNRTKVGKFYVNEALGIKELDLKKIATSVRV